MISFTEIPNSLRVPFVGVEFDNSNANKGTPQVSHKILVIGQRLAAGTAAAGVLKRITSAGEGETSFGRGSMLSAMFNALKKANRYMETWALALDDAATGVVAAGSITFGGAVTKAGTLYVYIGGHRVKTAVTVAQTGAATATAFAAAVNALTDMPVTAAVDGVNTAKVNLTCRWKGETGNHIDIRVNYYLGEELPTGLTTTIVAMTGGTTNPDIAAAIAVMGDEQWHTIITPYTDAANMTALEAELVGRWGAMRQIDGIAYAAYRGTHGATGTFGSGRNSHLVSCMGTGNVPEPPYIWAAVNGVVAASALSNDPARPLKTLVLTGLKPPSENNRWTQEERNLLLFDGISTYRADSGGRVLIDRQITMYQKNASGIDDESYLAINTPATLSYLRFSLRARITQKYPRHKLANDGTKFSPGQAIATPKILTAELLNLAREWERDGLVENLDQFKADLIVERDANNPNRVNALVPPDLINQFEQFAALMQFIV